MLQDSPTQILREPGSFILKTERLTLRQPTLADAKMIARGGGRARSQQPRRVPHPYSLHDANRIRPTIAATGRETLFLIEHNHVVIGLVGINWDNKQTPEIGYCLGVDYWGKGFATEAARAVIDYLLKNFLSSICTPAHVFQTRPHAVFWRNAAFNGPASSCIVSSRLVPRRQSTVSAWSAAFGLR